MINLQSIFLRQIDKKARPQSINIRDLQKKTDQLPPTIVSPFGALDMQIRDKILCVLLFCNSKNQGF